MPFTLVTAAVAGTGAVTKVAADSGNGNKYVNKSGKARLVVLNEGTPQSVTLTIAIPASADDRLADGNVIADLVISIGSGDLLTVVKALPPEVYNQTSGDDKDAVTMTWGGTVTNVKLAMVEPLTG